MADCDCDVALPDSGGGLFFRKGEKTNVGYGTVSDTNANANGSTDEPTERRWPVYTSPDGGPFFRAERRRPVYADSDTGSNKHNTYATSAKRFDAAWKLY